MAKITQTDGKTNQWWQIEHLIAGLDADRDVKCLLFLIHLHRNARRGCAWAKQETLAWEMNVSLSTLERAFRTAKKLGVLDVRRIRTGKRPDEQYNEYWIVIARVEKLQRAEPQHPSPSWLNKNAYLNKGTLELAEFLSQNNIPATFFVVGKHVRENREVVEKVAKLGHLIGNHTDTHPSLVKPPIDADELTREVVAADREIQELVGTRKFFLRTPGGEPLRGFADALSQNAELQRYFGQVNWDIQFGDYEIGSPWREFPLYTLELSQELHLEGIRKARQGVVLLHDWSADPPQPRGEELRRKNRTLELTKWLIPRLTDDFQFVALDQIPESCYDVRPA